MIEVAEDTGMRQRDDGVWIIRRARFASDHFNYKPGQHVVFAGPTQRGKTQLAFQLLEYTASPVLPAYVAVSKPRDPVTSREGKRLGYRRTSEWPVTPKIKEMFKDGKPSGYLIWADMRDSDTAIPNASALTRKLITDVYANGARGKPCILVLDDTVTKSKVLGLDREMVMIATMSGAMGIGGWYFVQKPTDAGKASLWSFSQSDHIFVFRDPDKRNRIRYTEIGGFDSREVERISLTLDRYQALYLERAHGYMCIVDSR